MIAYAIAQLGGMRDFLRTMHYAQRMDGSYRPRPRRQIERRAFTRVNAEIGVLWRIRRFLDRNVDRYL